MTGIIMSEALVSFSCTSHIYRKRVREVYVKRSEGLLKGGDETSKSEGK